MTKLKYVLAITLLLTTTLAATNAEYTLKTCKSMFAEENKNMNVSMLKENNERVLKVNSNDKSVGQWAIATEFDAESSSFDIEFEASVDADDSNDESIFVFVYGGEFGLGKCTKNAMGNMDGLEYVGLFCNGVEGDSTEHVYCVSGAPQVYHGVLKGSSLGPISQVGGKPIGDGWSEIEVDAESDSDKVTVVIAGWDGDSSKSIEWKVKNVRLNGEKYSFDEVYLQDAGKKIEMPAVCGNDKKKGDEACDGEDVETGYECASDCQSKSPICGDGLIIGEEVCDRGNVTEGYECSSDCSEETPICGDGVVVEGEACDGEEGLEEGFECAEDCSAQIPICGDGLMVGSEECDSELGTEEGKLCTSDCKLLDVSEDQEEFLNKLSQAIDGLGEEGTSSESVSVSSATIEKQMIAASAGINESAVNFCDQNQTVCPSEYAVAAAQISDSGINLEEGFSGEIGVFESGGNRYIGLKPSNSSLLDVFSGNWIWVVVAMVILIGLIIGAGAIIALAYYFLVYKKRNSGGL